MHFGKHKLLAKDSSRARLQQDQANLASMDGPYAVPDREDVDRVQPLRIDKERCRQKQKCISTYLMYPTFLSSTASSVILTLGAVKNLTCSDDSSRQRQSQRRQQEATVNVPARPVQPEPLKPRRREVSFKKFCASHICRETFLAQLSREDLASLRLVSKDLSKRATPLLFREITIDFRPCTFTRASRMSSLERIGHHVRKVLFRMPHTTETFLPPLIDPFTGEEQRFLYDPRTGFTRQSPSLETSHGDQSPTWFCQQQGSAFTIEELLIKQYGPLFHAATNVSSFIRAFKAMPLIRHLHISCPDQQPSQRYRRSVVDYALTSLRMAIERAPLKKLSSLSLTPIHPGALLYLRPQFGLGARPDSLRRWSQIKKLAIQMDGWDFAQTEPDECTDHLKILHSYLTCFTKNLTRMLFRWGGPGKGPCPFTLDMNTSVFPTRPISRQSSTSSPRERSTPTFPHRASILLFSKLQYFELANANIDAQDIGTFIERHHKLALRECDLQQLHLRQGSWDDALAVLTRISGDEKWKEKDATLP